MDKNSKRMVGLVKILSTRPMFLLTYETSREYSMLYVLASPIYNCNRNASKSRIKINVSFMIKVQRMAALSPGCKHVIFSMFVLFLSRSTCCIPAAEIKTTINHEIST
jgi:hypothetical protein